MRSPTLALLLFLALTASAQQPSPLAPYIKEDAPLLVLNHVRIIDGTGAAPVEDQRIVLISGKIQTIEPANATTPLPANAKMRGVQRSARRK